MQVEICNEDYLYFITKHLDSTVGEAFMLKTEPTIMGGFSI